MNNSALKKTVVTAIGVVGFTTLSSSLLAASFDCSKATTSIEKLICGSPAVSNLDEQLDAAYKSALERISDKETLKQQQRTWLKEKRNTCKDATCLFKEYQQRLVELSNVSADVDSQSLGNVATATKPASTAIVIPENKRIENQKMPLKFKLDFGNSYPLCQPYVDMLNKTKYMEYPSCERKLLKNFHNFEAVAWEEIKDSKEIKSILKDLASVSFARKNKLNSKSYHDFLMGIDNYVNGGKTKLFVYSFDLNKDGMQEKVYREVVKNGSNDCEIEERLKVKVNDVDSSNAANNGYFDPYVYMRSGTHNQLFVFNNQLINSMWFSSSQSIELWSSTSYQAECKISIN